MRSVIEQHMEQYPKMQIQDAFKLIYQSEFGGGHMIDDKEKSLDWIKKEYAFIREQNQISYNRVSEDIGGDMCRVYLRVLEQGLSAETLNEMFVQSANTKAGTVEGLGKKLEQFLDICEEYGFLKEQVKRAVVEWKAKGYPAIHHSEAFRENYFPAYRVVMKKYAERLEVFEKIDTYLQTNVTASRPIVIAIDGMAGSGKSVLGQLLQEIYHCSLFHMDDFFLQPHQRTPGRLAEPGGNVDYERFKLEVLDQLDNRDGLWYQKYDCSTQSLKEKEYVPYNKLVIIEGAYSLHPYFEDRADLAFFLEISDELQIERICKRNGEWMLKRFVEEWIPMEHKYFEEFRIKESCQVIGVESSKLKITSPRMNLKWASTR